MCHTDTTLCSYTPRLILLLMTLKVAYELHFRISVSRSLADSLSALSKMNRYSDMQSSYSLSLVLVIHSCVRSECSTVAWSRLNIPPISFRVIPVDRSSCIRYALRYTSSWSLFGDDSLSRLMSCLILSNWFMNCIFIVNSFVYFESN